MLDEFPEHDLRFRSSVKQHYKYFHCSRCKLRVAMKTVDSGVACRSSLLNRPCHTAGVALDDISASAAKPVQLCAVCQSSECMYACIPCMRKCACKVCASALRVCPICRVAVNHWKQIFESGIQGSAADIEARDEITGPVPFPPPARERRVRDEFDLSDDSLSSDADDVEYIEPDPPVVTGSVRIIRVQRPPVSDEDWARSDADFPSSWCLAALKAKRGNRATAYELLQSAGLCLRFRIYDTLRRKFMDMGFTERDSQICLLLNNGHYPSALDELIDGNWANVL
jgi:hypothetical protein